MFFWRKPEYPEETHTCMGRTCKFYTGRPQLGIKPGTLWLWSSSANHCAFHQPPLSASYWLKHTWPRWSAGSTTIKSSKPGWCWPWGIEFDTCGLVDYWSKTRGRAAVKSKHWVHNGFQHSCGFYWLQTAHSAGSLLLTVAAVWGASERFLFAAEELHVVERRVIAPALRLLHAGPQPTDGAFGTLPAPVSPLAPLQPITLQLSAGAAADESVREVFEWWQMFQCFSLCVCLFTVLSDANQLSQIVFLSDSGEVRWLQSSPAYSRFKTIWEELENYSDTVQSL